MKITVLVMLIGVHGCTVTPYTKVEDYANMQLCKERLKFIMESPPSASQAECIEIEAASIK